jgi:hypothetical protein
MEKQCVICNDIFGIKTYPSGRKETFGRFNSRKCCSKKCGLILAQKVNIETRTKPDEEKKLGRQERNKKYYERDKEKRAKEQTERWKNDADFRKRRSTHAMNRRKTDPNYRLIETLRDRTRKSIIKEYKNTKTIDLLGASIDDVRKHIESLWLPNMNWENHGIKGWHIDHIIPLSSCENEEQMIELCHYTNLQPLWAIDNLKKSDKI